MDHVYQDCKDLWNMHLLEPAIQYFVTVDQGRKLRQEEKKAADSTALC